MIASDSRITLLQKEAEILEEDADGSVAAPAHETKAGSKASPHPPVPPTVADTMMERLRQGLSELSMQDKVARLEEVYEDLDALVRMTSRVLKAYL